MVNPSQAIVFIKNDDPKATMRHIPVDDDPKWLAKLKYVLDYGSKYADLVGPLLVSHTLHGPNGEDKLMFYPLPYLFRTERERKQAAERLGKQAPPDAWVRRKLKVLANLCGREEAQVA
jgi:hypothetical protein